MYLVNQLQTTLRELDRASLKAGHRFNHFNFLKARTSKTIEFYLNQTRAQSLIASLSALPHRLSQHSESTSSDAGMAKLSQTLIDDLSAVLLKVSRYEPADRQRFIEDQQFALQLIDSLSHGWHDCCQDCGESLQLKLSFTDDQVVLAHKQIKDTGKMQCAFSEPPRQTSVSLSTPSRILVISDSLNEFIISNNPYLTEAYDKFLATEMKKIASSSIRGKLMMTEFYASHNLAYFYVGKGRLGVNKLDDRVELQRLDADSSPLLVNIDSHCITLMDYTEFTGFCHQLGKKTYDTLKLLNASIVEVHERHCSLSYQLTETGDEVKSIAIHPAQPVAVTEDDSAQSA